MKAFDFLLIYGACVLVSTIFVIQLPLGIWVPIILIALVLFPSIWSGINAFLDKSVMGDADTFVRSIFIYIFFYLLILGPFHFIYHTVGFKVYRLPPQANHLEPLLLPGDAVIFDRDAYGLRTPGVEMNYDSVHVGDIVYHKSEHRPESKPDTADIITVHYVLASPQDTLMARNGVVTVNGKPVELPSKYPYLGRDDFGPIIVPRRELFVVDNDWDFFPIYLKNVVGRASGILWSRRYDGKWRTERFGMPIKSPRLLGESVSVKVDSSSTPDTLAEPDSVSIED